MPDPLLIVLVIAVPMALLAAHAHRQERTRQRLLAAWARSRGFTLHMERRSGWESEYPAYGLFTRGYGRHSRLHLEGEVDGRRVRCLDYRYTISTGRSRRIVRYSIVLVDANTPVVPLHIRREHVIDRVGEFLGGGDINFESDAFSRRFHVSSADRKWAYDIIRPAMMDLLLASDMHHVEFGFAELAVYRRGPLTGRRCQEDLKLARRILDLLPADVLAQLRGGSR